MNSDQFKTKVAKKEVLDVLVTEQWDQSALVTYMDLEPPVFGHAQRKTYRRYRSLVTAVRSLRALGVSSFEFKTIF